jgi:L-histidine Nalpha-methyltransferase
MDVEQARTRSRPDVGSAVARAVRQGLLARPKWLPPWLLYDAHGSELFEAISRLPEYYLTRTERAILEEHASAIIDAIIDQTGTGGPVSIVELGAGTATKTRLLIQALLRKQEHALYVPADVSPAALSDADRQLRRTFPRLEVRPVVAQYPEELDWIETVPGRRLVLLLGSNLGNFEPGDAAELLRAVREHLRPDDRLLVSTDLRKSPALLLPAYDDSAGVTAAFSRNVLLRINRELGARFEPSAFRHVACWNSVASRVELYLESAIRQSVFVQALGLRVSFEAGERLKTENSYKFTEPMLQDLLRSAGFAREACWADPRGWLSVHLARA